VRFLRAIRVTDFRSITGANISGIGDITPVVGLNGSGKSNLMRALNLFFRDAVEGETPIDLRRDFREPGRQVKLRVAVEMDLDFGVFDALRHELDLSLQELAAGSRQITIRKEWTLDPITREPLVTVSAGRVGGPITVVPPDRMSLVTRLLTPVRFRYIPNHIHPSQVLSAEEDEIRRMLFDRLRKRQILQEQVVTSIGQVATELMQPIIDVMRIATGDVKAVELATPADWRELAWAFGVKLRGTQTQSFDALVHGSGVQSLLAYAILHAIDTSFSGTFGWRKGAIWAIEEPESFLHVGLQEELARLLQSYGSDNPLQIIFSTHATPFLGVAPEGVLAEMDASGRTELRKVDRAELVRTAFTTRVAPYAHALHAGPPKPMLLVEGRSDRDLTLRAFVEAQLANPFDVRALSDLDPTLQGGDEVARWLKYNAAALAARPDTSPVFVLRDWETGQGVVNQIQAALAGHPESRCVVWPSDLTNPDLSPSFVGIEKFLSTAFIEHAAQNLGLPLLAPAVPGNVPWRYDVARAAFLALKGQMHQELTQRNDPADLAPLRLALPWLLRQLADTPPLL
jgi:predicted ATPase